MMHKMRMSWRSWVGAALLACCTGWSADSIDDLTGPWRLFVDDFLVQSKSNVVRTYHPFQKYAGNPVLNPDTPWEQLNYVYGTVLPNESRTGYRMWYQSLRTNNSCNAQSIQLYATSSNGINWIKPALYQHAWCASSSNNMYYRGFMTSVMQTPEDPDPARRYKFMNFENGAWSAGWSSNGINVVSAPNNPVFTTGGDSGQFCWDPRTRKYFGYVKNSWFDTNGLRRRAVSLATTDNFTNWPSSDLILWPDAVDDRWSSNIIQRTHFYGLSAFPYESMYLGFLWIHRATNLQENLPGYQIGPIFVELVSSHDGVNWTRQEGNRPAILPLGPNGSWDDGMVFTARAPIVEGNTIKLWYGGFSQVHDIAMAKNKGAIGLATLRKDGFASLDAGATNGTILTTLLTNSLGLLHLNYETTPAGWIKAEVLDVNGDIVPGFDAANCVPLTGNSLAGTFSWGEQTELPQPEVRLRFILQNASIYSFMIGPVSPPTISQHPSSRTNFAGTTATFNVQAAGNEPIQYHWRKDNVDLFDGANFSNSATATLTINNVTEADAGSFVCVVANPGGSVTSSPAMLIVSNSVPSCLSIANGNFEGGFNIVGLGYIANNWTQWESAPGVTVGYDESVIKYNGSHSQRLRVGGLTNSTSGGAYQRLPAVPGQSFTVSAWIYAGDNLATCSLGVDTAGGTNAAGSIVWSSSTNVAWVQKTVTSVAISDYITVFLKVNSPDVTKRNGYFDDVAASNSSQPLRLAAQGSANGVMLSWPECPNARLERSTGLLNPTWTVVTNRVTFTNGRKQLTLGPVSGADFFRLVQE